MTLSDVLVVGAGPAGSATAIAAALHGLTVTLVDPRTGPVDKACGEGLMPSTAETLRRLGVEVAGQPLSGIRYASADAHRSVTGRFRTGAGLGVRRTALSEALLARASDVGVLRWKARVCDVTESSGGIEATLSGQGGPFVLNASYAVICDGLHSPLRRRLGWDRAPATCSPSGRTVRPRYGLRRHFRLPAGTHAGDLVSVFWAGECEAYVTPLAPDLINVAILCEGGQSYDAWLEKFPALDDLLADADPVSAVRGAGPMRQRVHRTGTSRMLLAGDAAGYVDALTGEGIGVALASAELVAQCLAAGSTQRYPARLSRLTARSRGLTSALLALSSTRTLRPHLVSAAERFPGIFARFVNTLA